ncbi:MAG: hypothetical protein KBC95_01405 [Candidatus Peribacteraceae bacterium]|nr:hypothetical protein [Candidatus Peribacteraceae bacterium]
MPAYVVNSPSWFSATQELRGETGNLVAELVMLKRLSYALAEARLPGRTVRFGYEGWTGRKIFIQDEQGKDIATATNLSWWNRDVRVLIDGKEYLWKQKDWWGLRSGWFTDGKEIIECRRRWWGKMEIVTLTAPQGAELILTLFGMYLLMLQEVDSMGASATF